MHRWRYRWHYWHALLDAIDDLRWELRLRERRAMHPQPLPPADPPGTVPPLRPEHIESPELIVGAPLAHHVKGDRTVGKKKDKAEKKKSKAVENEDGGGEVDFSKFAKKRSGIKKRVIRDMHQEMNTEDINGVQGWTGTALNPQMPDGHKFVMLERQCGNVAEALTADDADSERLYDECIKAAVVAAAWAQSLKRKGKGRVAQWVQS